MKDDVALLRCARADTPAAVPSSLTACEVCGAVIWVSHAVARELAAGYESVVTVCLTCPTTKWDDGADLRIAMPSSQIELFRRDGMTDLEIAGLLALVQISPTAAPEDLEATMKATNSDRAMQVAYLDALRSALVMVKADKRRN